MMQTSRAQPDEYLPVGLEATTALWHRWYLVVAGAIIAAAVAYLATPIARPVYSASAVLVRRAADLQQGQASSAAPQAPRAVYGRQNSGGTLQASVRRRSVLEGIVAAAGAGAGGINSVDLAPRIRVVDGPQANTIVVAVDDMSTKGAAESIGRATVDAVVASDRQLWAQGTDDDLHAIEAELAALPRALGDVQARLARPPAEVPAADAAEAGREAYRALLSQYAQTAAARRAGGAPLEEIRTLAVEEQPSQDVRARNVTVGLFSGAAMATLLILAARYWAALARMRRSGAFRDESR